MMDWYAKNALWIYWTTGDDEEVITDDELLCPGDGNLIEETKVAKIFRIKTDIFQFETPLCEVFKEFNYLLKIDIGVIQIGDEIYFESYKCYENLEDGELKGEALNCKAMLEKSMNVEEELSDNARSHYSPIDE
ncbi:hypothetical protein Tco_1463954 [Tanacetum coccineum]